MAFVLVIATHLTLTMLWGDSADDKLMRIFLFFQEHKVKDFMQIVF